jgi:hypothetical protein
LATHIVIEPETRISTIRETYLRRVTPQAFELLAGGLREAGFPELREQRRIAIPPSILARADEVIK